MLLTRTLLFTIMLKRTYHSSIVSFDKDISAQNTNNSPKATEEHIYTYVCPYGIKAARMRVPKYLLTSFNK